MLEKLKQDKKLLYLSAVVIIVITGILWSFVIKTPAYSVIIDGKAKFAVSNQEMIKDIISKIEKQKEKKVNKDLELVSNIEIKRTLAARSSLLKTKDLEQELSKVLNFKAMAVELVVNGKTIAYLDSKESANKLLERIKNNYEDVDEGEKLVNISFEEKIEIKEKPVDVRDVMSIDEAYTLITTGTKNPEKYIVKEGDSLWLIARKNDMYVDEIMQANNLTTEDLSLGQELIITKSKPYINVIAKVEGEKVEKIPYETKVIVDNSAPTSIRVKQAGKEGEKKVVYVATKRNGVIEDKEVKEETILQKAVDKIIVKGNKVTIASRGSSGSGALDWPAVGTITSRFRDRGGTHTGIDIATRIGSPIRAADSGYVTFTGWQGSYGNFIIVNHGNGIVTRYAHCNSINVSVGQKVATGQVIGTIGSTGRSTGPHLHFEVLVNGGFRDPLAYLR